MAETSALLRHAACGCISSADSACEKGDWEALGLSVYFSWSKPSVSKSVWWQVKGGDVAISFKIWALVYSI